MKNISFISVFNALSLPVLLLIMPLVMLSSCSQSGDEETIPGPIPSDEVLVKFDLSKGGEPATYALGGDDERNVSELDLLLFDETGNLAHMPIQGSITATDPTTGAYTVEATIKIAKYSNIAILANSRDMVAAAVAHPTTPLVVGMTQDDAMKLFELTIPLKWNATSGTAGYKDIPMYGGTGYVAVTGGPSSNLFQATLLRMLVRVDMDIAVGARQNLDLKSIRVYNRNSVGMLQPSKVAGKPNLPSAPNKITTPLVYAGNEITNTGVSSVGEIYLLESAIVDPMVDTKRLPEATCLVVGGFYTPDGGVKGTKELFYRVDFAMTDVNKVKHFYDIIRNHQYKVNIISVSGPGEEDPEVALEKESSYIEVEVIDWGNGGSIGGDIDGQNILRVEPGELTLSYAEQTEGSTFNKIAVSSTHTAGWYISKVTGSDGSTPPVGGWLSTDLAIDDIQMTDKVISVLLTENTGADRIGYIYINSGPRMSYKVKVTQRVKGLIIRQIAWDDYDGTNSGTVNDGDVYFTSITIKDGNGPDHLRTVSPAGVISPEIDLANSLSSVTVVYHGHTLVVPASKFSLDNSTNILTITDRTLIGKAIHLHKIRLDYTGHYIQVIDINIATTYANWEPIGIETPITSRFTGSYDGGSGNGGTGFKIYNLNIDRPTEDYVGLFGATENASFKNIHIVWGNIKGRANVGAICGSNRGSIINCTNTATVEGAGDYVGGIIGVNRGSIAGCTNTANITGSGSRIGGIAGSSYIDIANCTNSGIIAGVGASSSFVGGICGSTNTTSSVLTNCKNLSVSTIIATNGSHVGGIAGRHLGIGRADNCTNAASVLGKDIVGGLFGFSAAIIRGANSSNTGVVTGVNSVGNICGESTGTISGFINTMPLTATGDNVGGICGWSRNDVGTNSTITDCQNSATGVINGKGEYVGGIAGRYDSTEVVENCSNAATITGENDRVGGLFGASLAIISGITNSNTGIVKGVSYVGNICGESYGTISDFHNTLPITATGNYVGGVCGYNHGTVKDCTNNAAIKGKNDIGGICGSSSGLLTTITNCQNLILGAVTGTGNGVGGIAGAYSGTGTIVNCTNAAPITGEGNFVGGLFGISACIITGNSSNSGSVTGDSYVGNICGENSGTISGITNNIPLTAIGGHIGGLVGSNKGTIESCINNATVSSTGIDFSNYIGGIVGYSEGATSQITNCQNQAGGAVEGKRHYVGGIAGAHMGTADIGTCTNAATVKGMDYVGGLFGHSRASITAAGNTSTGAVAGASYVGNICGESFGTISGITNNIPLTATGSYIGGLVGASKGTIENCINTATVTGTGTIPVSSFVGGIVGHSSTASSVITNCQNLVGGTVTATGDEVGGIAGNHSGTGIVEKCANGASVTGGGTRIGGLFGMSYALISGKNNFSTGTVKGEMYVGNICGVNFGEISYFNNTLSIISTTASGVGGICGLNRGGTITNCTNSGTMTGNSNVGGISGLSVDGTLKRCSNVAAIEATKELAGGIIGSTTKVKGIVNVENCFNTGAIHSADHASGIIGSLAYTTLKSSYNIGAITGTRIGAIAVPSLVDPSSAIISNCYFGGAANGMPIMDGTLQFGNHSPALYIGWPNKPIATPGWELAPIGPWTSVGAWNDGVGTIYPTLAP